MARPVEIATYLLASVIALGGGYIGAEVLFGEVSQARPAPERAEPGKTAVPTEGVEHRNTRYGFSFRHPEGWQTTQVPDPRVAAAVVRPDGVMCLVSVNERDLPSDDSGKPRQLSTMLSGFQASHILQAVPLPGAKVSDFEKATLGGQEARSFVVAASLPPLGPLKLQGYATLRRFGAVVLMCMAPESLVGASEVRRAFKLVHASFRFD